MSSTTSQTPKWKMTADYVETCNCDYGCSCNFNGFPTYGSCQALVLIHIRSGSYGAICAGLMIYVGKLKKKKSNVSS